MKLAHMTTKLLLLLLAVAACSTTSELGHPKAAPPLDNFEIANGHLSKGTRGEAAIIAAADNSGEYTRLCRGGSAEACGALGAIYHDGVAVEQNYERAAELFEASCALGSASACGRLAVMYTQSDKGVSKDTTRALSLFKRTCAFGNQAACQLRDQLPSAP